jgi:hypothetical protein
MGPISIFCKLWSRTRPKRPQKMGKIFSNVNQNKLFSIVAWASICKRLRSPGIDSKEPIPLSDVT